jgi:hypothetical protein
MAPPTRLISSTSASSSGFPAHLNSSISRPHLGFYLHHYPCHACLRHQPPEPPHGPQKVAIAKTDRINYTTMEDNSVGEPVLTGTFFLNDHSVVVLFDSGATHDFVNKACTKKCKLMIEPISAPYMISTPGG